MGTWISWLISTLPLIALIGLLVIGWRRVRQVRVAETYEWG